MGFKRTITYSASILLISTGKLLTECSGLTLCRPWLKNQCSGTDSSQVKTSSLDRLWSPRGWRIGPECQATCSQLKPKALEKELQLVKDASVLFDSVEAVGPKEVAVADSVGQIHGESLGTYGYRKDQAALCIGRNLEINHKLVAAVVAELGLEWLPKRKSYNRNSANA